MKSPTEEAGIQHKNNSFSNLILLTDQLGLALGFKVEGKTKYNSISGGILSILIYILCVLTYFLFGRELYLKQDPTVIQSNYFENDPRLFNLPSKNFNFFVGIQDIDFNYYIDPTIYTLEIGLSQITVKNNSKNEEEFNFNYNFL